MKREEIIQELQRRLNQIKTDNGYPVSVRYVFRNPDVEPSPDTMPCINLFEMEDSSIELASRSASTPPIIKKNLRVVLEMWVKSTSEGRCSKDVSDFLKSVRQVVFSDGVTLGKYAAMVSEVEVSRMFRPDIQSNVGGIGTVLEFIYIEDFSTL